MIYIKIKVVIAVTISDVLGSIEGSGNAGVDPIRDLYRLAGPELTLVCSSPMLSC